MSAVLCTINEHEYENIGGNSGGLHMRDRA